MPLWSDDQDELLAAAEDWEDITIEVLLDSGACRHVMAREEAPQYVVQDSPGSRRGQNFVAANGAKIPNEGQVTLNLEAEVGGEVTLLSSTFQIANLTRPLMSVSQICEQGFQCVFESDGARVVNKEGLTVCKFDKRNQLYVAEMKLQAPDRFHRPS